MKFTACCITRSKLRGGPAPSAFGLLLASLALSVASGPLLHAEDDSPDTRIQAVASLNSLDAPDIKPWHLKVTFTTFDGAGKPSGQGTAEEWWISPNSSRLEISEGGKTSVSLRTADGVFHSSEAQSVASRCS